MSDHSNSSDRISAKEARLDRMIDGITYIGFGTFILTVPQVSASICLGIGLYKFGCVLFDVD